MKYTYIVGVLLLSAVVGIGSFSFSNMQIEKKANIAQVSNAKNPTNSAYTGGGTFKPSGKEGCMNKLACNFDKKAIVAGNCTFAVFDASIAKSDSETCSLSKGYADIEKPSKIAPAVLFDPVPPQGSTGCAKGNSGLDATNPDDDHIGATFNVHIHQWTTSPNGQVLSRSTSFYGSRYSEDGTLPEYSGTNACAGLKALKTKR